MKQKKAKTLNPNLWQYQTKNQTKNTHPPIKPTSKSKSSPNSNNNSTKHKTTSIPSPTNSTNNKPNYNKANESSKILLKNTAKIVKSLFLINNPLWSSNSRSRTSLQQFNKNKPSFLLLCQTLRNCSDEFTTLNLLKSHWPISKKFWTK